MEIGDYDLFDFLAQNDSEDEDGHGEDSEGEGDDDEEEGFTPPSLLDKIGWVIWHTTNLKYRVPIFPNAGKKEP